MRTHCTSHIFKMKIPGTLTLINTSIQPGTQAFTYGGKAAHGLQQNVHAQLRI